MITYNVFIKDGRRFGTVRALSLLAALKSARDMGADIFGVTVWYVAIVK